MIETINDGPVKVQLIYLSLFSFTYGESAKKIQNEKRERVWERERPRTRERESRRDRTRVIFNTSARSSHHEVMPFPFEKGLQGRARVCLTIHSGVHSGDSWIWHSVPSCGPSCSKDYISLLIDCHSQRAVNSNTQKILQISFITSLTTDQ